MDFSERHGYCTLELYYNLVFVCTQILLFKSRLVLAMHWLLPIRTYQTFLKLFLFCILLKHLVY